MQNFGIGESNYLNHTSCSSILLNFNWNWRGVLMKLFPICLHCKLPPTSEAHLSRALFHVPVRIRFFYKKKNEWAGEKGVVTYAHPSHSRTGTPHGWMSHILCCTRTGAKGHTVLTVIKWHVPVRTFLWPDRLVTLGIPLGTSCHFVLQVLSFAEFSKGSLWYGGTLLWRASYTFITWIKVLRVWCTYWNSLEFISMHEKSLCFHSYK
jgi:hypothetical protein